MLENSSLNSKNNTNQNKKELNFYNIEELIDKYPYGYSFKEILDEECGEDNYKKEELLREYYDYIESKQNKMELEKINSWKEDMEKLNQEQIDLSKKILETEKNKMTLENIENFKQKLLKKNPYQYINIKNPNSFWPHKYSIYLAKEYFKKINKKINFNSINNISKYLKKYYWDKTNFKGRGANYRNFYEIEKNDD